MTIVTPPQTARRWWLSWYHDRTRGFELTSPWWTSPWWISREGFDIICAAVVAASRHAAEEIILSAYDDRPDGLRWRFAEEQAANWSPFGDRFPRADWMRWPEETARPAWTAATLAEALGIRTTDITGGHTDMTGGHPGHVLTETHAARLIEEYAIQVTANVIDGYLDLTADHLTEDDDRLAITDCPVTHCRIDRITVGPWAVDEEVMTRADRGLSMEGLSRVTAWVDDATTGAPTAWVVRRSDREVRGWVPDRADAELVLTVPGQVWAHPGAPEGAAKTRIDLAVLSVGARVLVDRGPDLASLPSRGWVQVARGAADPWSGTRLALVRAFMPGVIL